jgi:alpha-amylase/alpha-mannosidase (GH57 family)
MPRKARLAILWHMHQPCYRNPFSGKFDLPWLRLHALKDYLGMARLLEEFPALRLTFNLVPSLLAGLRQYLDGGSDAFEELFRKPADELSPEETQFVVRHFFSIQHENHIKPYRRYESLYQKKMKRLAQQPDPEWRNVFSVAELRDLQVWFHLTFLDESYKSGDPRVLALLRQGQNFSEGDKETVRAVGGEILAGIVPEYRRLREGGRIELSTSPFYHPILPLLLDPQAGRKANPRLAPYELDFNWEEDAWAQLQSALDLMERTFGARPRGIWPPEGGLSEPVLHMLAKAGMAWTASDEEVLSRSLPRPLERDGRLMASDPGAHYSSYSLPGLPLKIFFRDRILSDLVGFYYQKFPAGEAAADLFRRIKAIAAGGGDPVIPIILDGENAWEFYPGSGREFLREFYRLLSEDREVETVTFSAAAEGRGRELARLRCGSWINGNFDIWIGDPEDQKGWELLKAARDAYMEEKPRLPREKASAIEDLLYTAEGSDWFWWFGRENYTPDIEIFDSLFRLNLQKIYEILGKPVPPGLLAPIPASTPADRLQVIPPRDYVQAVVDGEASDYFEWTDAGRVDVLSYGGAMNIANPLVKTLYFGFSRDRAFLRIDAKKHARTYFENGFSLRLRLECGGAGWECEIGPLAAAAAGALDLPAGGGAAVGRIIEVQVPLAALKAGEGGEMTLQMFWSFHGQPFQTIPARAPLRLRVPTAKDYAANWQV